TGVFAPALKVSPSFRSICSIRLSTDDLARFVRRRQGDADCGAFRWACFDLNRSAVALYRATANRQAEPGAFAFGLCGEERLPKLWQVARPHSGAGIGEFDDHGRITIRHKSLTASNCQGPTPGHCVTGVGY